jgi:hypothetical protein
MKESWSETLWNEKIRRRCGVVDIAEKAREAKLRWYGHVIRRDEGELGRGIMKLEIKSLPAWFLKSSSVVMI